MLFTKDQTNSEEGKLYVDGCGVSILFNRTDEGVVVDMYPHYVANEPLDTTYFFDDEADLDGDEKIGDDWKFLMSLGATYVDGFGFGFEITSTPNEVLVKCYDSKNVLLTELSVSHEDIANEVGRVE